MPLFPRKPAPALTATPVVAPPMNVRQRLNSTETVKAALASCRTAQEAHRAKHKEFRLALDPESAAKVTDAIMATATDAKTLSRLQLESAAYRGDHALAAKRRAEDIVRTFGAKLSAATVELCNVAVNELGSIADEIAAEETAFFAKFATERQPTSVYRQAVSMRADIAAMAAELQAPHPVTAAAPPHGDFLAVFLDGFVG